MKTTAITYIKVNGITVASAQFESKDAKKVSREASHWLCDMEFNVRATLQASGTKYAKITLGSDNIVIEHEWENGFEGKFGCMREGKIVA